MSEASMNQGWMGRGSLHATDLTHVPGPPDRNVLDLARVTFVQGAVPPPVTREAVVAIGNFDGVHRGHADLIAHARREATSRGIECVVLTFDPHPAHVLRPHEPTPLVSTPIERAAWMHALGVDHVLVWPFDADVQSQTPEQFVQAITRFVHPRAIIHGPGFAVGRGRAGTSAVLAEVGRTHGFEMIEVVPVTAPSGDTTHGSPLISSSAIRRLVETGSIADASTYLGRLPTYLGTVRHGNKMGRTIGFPTANVHPDGPRATPLDGVYAAWVERNPLSSTAVFHAGAISIGDRPTFNGTIRLVEAFLPGFDGDLYDQELRLHFVARLRGQVRFESIDALVTQMNADVATCLHLLGEPAKQP